MLELSKISKTFGGVKAVQNVSISIQPREVRGLIGPNGAGKSTLVNLISGLLTQSSGLLSLNGVSFDGLSTPKRAKLGIARTFQNLRIFSSLTVHQNIEVANNIGQSSGRENDDFLKNAIEKFDLSEKLNTPADSLSYGFLRRLEIVLSLIHI